MKVCVDPGHGGDDPGAVSGGVKEKDMVLGYAFALAAELERRGHDTLLTRRDDSFVGLSLRAQRANDWGADCFVSVHANAASAATANGAWVIYDDRSAEARGPALARAVFDQLRMIPGLEDTDEDREVYADRTAWVGNRNLTVISKTACPAVLVELGFLTNDDDLDQLRRADTIRAVANAIADGIETWNGRAPAAAPAPVVALENTVVSMPPLPHPEKVHPLHRPVSELARPGETGAAFLDRVGSLLSPFWRSLWDAIVRRILARAIEEVDEALDRALG